MPAYTATGWENLPLPEARGAAPPRSQRGPKPPDRPAGLPAEPAALCEEVPGDVRGAGREGLPAGPESARPALRSGSKDFSPFGTAEVVTTGAVL